MKNLSEKFSIKISNCFEIYTSDVGVFYVKKNKAEIFGSRIANFWNIDFDKIAQESNEGSFLSKLKL